MRNRFRLHMFAVTVVTTVLMAGQAGYGEDKKGTPSDPCSTASLPADIQNKLTTKYAGWKIVTPAFLNSDERKDWTEKHHGKECPGLVTGKFSDDNQVGYVLNLILQKKGEIREQVLYFHPSRDGFGVEIVVPSETGDGEYTNVIEKLPPGRHQGEDGYHTIKTDSLQVTWGASAAYVIYYWKQGRRHEIASGD